MPSLSAAGKRRTVVAGLVLAIAAAMALATACSGSAPPGTPPGEDTDPDAEAERQVRAAADAVVEAINSRRYGDLVDLFAPECLRGVSRDQVAEDWKQFAEQVGDPNFRLTITQFRVDSVSATRAEVTSRVIVHTSTADIELGSDEDPFFDVFVKQGGIWKAADRSC